MQLRRAVLLWYRSVDLLDFELGPFTVLFGKNNAGKTNVLEAIYGVLAPGDLPGDYADGVPARGLRGADTKLPPFGAIDVQLDPKHAFDNEVLRLDDGKSVRLAGDSIEVELNRLPTGQASFTGTYAKPGLLFVDPRPFIDQVHGLRFDQQLDEQFVASCFEGPRPHPLFVDWDYEDIIEKVTAGINAAVPLATLRSESTWLERVDGEPKGVWRVRPEVGSTIAGFAALANAFLPDFIDGAVYASFDVPVRWDAKPAVSVHFGNSRRSDYLREVGRGPARWIAAAIQIALHVQKHRHELAREFDATAASGATPSLSGHVLFIDEPEAHLHHSAVASIVRWCKKMTGLGFNIVVASHHEEFLRSATEGHTLVRVSRDADSGRTQATALPSLTTSRLLGLAADVGMHPAAALSIQRAILFVEGPLDEAVLDEYAGLELESAGVKIIPIHGTKNLEGLVAVELVTGLGIKTGVLTDATETATMLERAKKRRSSEEKKVIEVLRIAQERGHPVPTSFGVPEADLLFALPADAIRHHVCESFPGWKELVEECRESLGKTASDSVNWKAYAAEKYDLQIDTPGGVRELVRKLDLANVPLPSIRTVVNQVIEWAKATAS